MARMKYGEPDFTRLSSTTYLRTRLAVWTGDGGRYLEETLVQENKEFGLNRYGSGVIKINTEDIMVVIDFDLQGKMPKIVAAIDLNELEELPLTLERQIECLQLFCGVLIKVKDDVLDSRYTPPKAKELSYVIPSFIISFNNDKNL